MPEGTIIDGQHLMRRDEPTPATTGFEVVTAEDDMAHATKVFKALTGSRPPLPTNRRMKRGERKGWGEDLEALTKNRNALQPWTW